MKHMEDKGGRLRRVKDSFSFLFREEADHYQCTECKNDIAGFSMNDQKTECQAKKHPHRHAAVHAAFV